VLPLEAINNGSIENSFIWGLVEYEPKRDGVDHKDCQNYAFGSQNAGRVYSMFSLC
jgi:hypothetical protein